MRITLAIYITLFAVALVAVAQILYWKLVIAREGATTGAAGAAGASGAAGLTETLPGMDRMPDLDWLREQAQAWVDSEVDETELAPVREPLLAGV